MQMKRKDKENYILDKYVILAKPTFVLKGRLLYILIENYKKYSYITII